MPAKQWRYDIAYMRMALEWSNLSHCKRAKVGSLIVKGKMIISDGYNGQPSGFDNACEIDGKTDWKVIHAEANAILKCARHGTSCEGATLYVTLPPCRECCKLILQAGIERVVYLKPEEDRDLSGLSICKHVVEMTKKDLI
jgi:dCMP deaminase